MQELLVLMTKQSELCNRWNALAESFPSAFPNNRKILERATRDFRAGIARACNVNSFAGRAKDFPEVAMADALSDASAIF